MNDNAQGRRPTLTWALSVLGFSLAVLAVGLAIAAFTVASRSAGVVLETEAVVDAAYASGDQVVVTTLPPVEDPAVNNAPVPEAPVTGKEPEGDTAGVGEEPKSPPVSLVIEDLRLDYDGVIAVGLQENGAMEIPSVEEVGWYLHGATPGRPGATVLVAHVWWNGDPGPFRRLGRLDLGADITVRNDDGTVHAYQVVKRTMYDKDALPRDLWRNSGPETLVLITCGGQFNSASRRFEQNIVVYAVPSTDLDGVAS